MKKILAIVFAMILMLTGCSTDTAQTTDTEQQDETVTPDPHRWERTEDLNAYTALEKCSVCGATREYTITDNITYSGEQVTFTMERHNWMGDGAPQRRISNCDLGDAVIDCVSKLQESGEIIPAISEDLTVSMWDAPIESNTVFLNCGSLGAFRLNPQMTEICKVENYLGEGRGMQMTDTLRELLYQVWYYHPYDTWNGQYKDGTVTLQQDYKVDSAVEWVEIESIHVENKRGSGNHIALRFHADESQKVNVVLESYQSGDNRGSYETKEIELVKGKDATVDFNFYGLCDYSYFISIVIDHTRIELVINPTGTN